MKDMKIANFTAGAPQHRQEKLEPRPRIALLTPYNGGNLGDAAIQDAMIANIRLRLPAAEFSGICLNCENFIDRHGIAAFPLCAGAKRFYSMSNVRMSDRHTAASRESKRWTTVIKRALRRVPVLGWSLKAIWGCLREVGHWVKGYRFLKTQDLLIVSGGGQLNEVWGGPWSQPLALFKWATLARIAQIPYVIASVGVGTGRSRIARFFLSNALRIAAYRSYRDRHTREFAAGLASIAIQDPIVPDLALSLRVSRLSISDRCRSTASDRLTVAISPIAYARPGSWPFDDEALYDRYVSEMVQVVSLLLDRDYHLVIVCSSLGDNERAVADLLGRLDDESKSRLTLPQINTWRDLVTSLQDVDVLIASRLHSTILSFVSYTPVLAISFDPKVDWLMEDFGQTDYLLQIRDFSAMDVMTALEHASLRRKLISDEIASTIRRTSFDAAKQYDRLAAFAGDAYKRRSHNRSSIVQA